MTIFIIYNQNSNINKIVYEQYSNIQSQVKEMKKQYFFIDFLQDKNYLLKQYWFQLLNIITKNCCLSINELGYIFLYENNLTFLLDYAKFPQFHFTEGIQIQNYFSKFKQYCNFIKVKENRFKVVISYLEHFVRTSAKTLSGYHNQIKLNIEPLGELQFKSQTVIYSSKNFTYKLSFKKNLGEKLPNLFNSRQTLNPYQNTNQSDLVKIGRKFSLSITKKSKETPKLKKSQSSKYLPNQSDLKIKYKSKNLQNSQTWAFNKNQTFLMKPKNNSENRILRLKSQASQKISVQINKKSRRKIKCKTVQNSYPNSSLNILQQNPKRKLVKSKSNYDILRVQEQFRLSTMLKGPSRLSNLNQSSRKITPEKNKNNFTLQQKSKFSQLKSQFSNQMKNKTNKLKLSLKNQNNGNKKSQEFESRLKTSQIKSNQHQISQKIMFTSKSEFAINQVKNSQHLDRNNYFVTMKTQGIQSKLPSQQKSTSEYKNNFLKRSISKYRRGSDQNLQISKEEKKKYIIFEKSQQLIKNLSEEFPFQLSTINQMIQQFQQIWKCNCFSFFQKEKSATILNLDSSVDRKSDFYLYYNAHIQKKVQIQRQKIKYTEILPNSGYKRTINAQKVVNQIQKDFKNRNQALIQDNQDEKQLSVIHFSSKKFKSKIQHQKIRLIYQMIEKFKCRIKKITPERRFQVKNNSLQEGEMINKRYLSKPVINFKQILLKTRQLIHRIRNLNAQLFPSENLSSKQNNYKGQNQDQHRKIGPEIALFLREIYITLNEVFLSIAHYTQLKTKISLRIEVHLRSFWLIQQLTQETIASLKSIFTEVQKQIETWYAPMKIQQFQKKQLINIENMFQNLLLATFESPTFLAKRQEYLSKMVIVFQPKCYFQVEKMKKDLIIIDQFYEQKILQETETLDIDCVTVSITEAKLKLAEKLRKLLAQVQSSYEVYLKNLVSDLDKTLRNCVQIKPEMLFEQNYRQVKNKYLSKISQIEEVFMFIIQRRLIYLEYRPKTLVQIFHKLQQKRLKLYQYLSNLDSRLALYRKNMEQEITAIQIIDRRLKQTLKQLSIKLKNLINDLKDERDIGFNEKKILEMKEMFDLNNTEKIQLIKRMQVNQIIYWEDDTYFQKNIKALLCSLEFIKSDKYKLIYQSSISQIDWKQFLIFINSYTKLMNILEETKILKIFKSNYDVFIQSSKFIEVILYKGYSISDIQKFSIFELKLTKDSHQKLPNLIKKIAQMDKKSHQQILGILHAAKENQFYGLKRLAIINVKIEFHELQYFSQSLKAYQIYRIKNVQDIFDQMANVSCNQCEQFINNIQKFNQIAHELFYLKKTLINLNAFQQPSKEELFKSFHQRYWQLLENLKSQNKIYIKFKHVQKLFDQIQQQRQKLAEIFFNQKVRFFPRLSLLDINSLIDCFDWTNSEQILKNVQSLYSQIDDVIVQKNTRKIKKLRIGSDYIEFQKQLDPQAFNSIQFLKFLYASVQGLIQDSVSQSFKRICHMKIIAWYIYFTEQIECTFLLKGNLYETRSRIQLLIKQIGQQLRYDMYQHHKKYEIQQLKFFVDFVAKLQKVQDPQNSYLWANCIKVYEKNKKVIISQNDNQYEFGYEPKKPEAFDPQFKIQKGLKYGTSQHIQLYRLSANITGRPFVIMNLRKSALKNRMYKILDIIYKYDFFAVIDHDAIFENQSYGKLPSKNQNLISKKKPFQTFNLKDNEQHQLFYLKENSKYSLINQFYKELIYFSSYKQQLQGARQVKLPILMKYQKINLIPTNFRAQFRTIDRPSKLFSLQLMVLIQLNKYQDFFAKYQINLGKISSFFKLINEEFAMSFEKLTKILKDFDKFISSIDQSRKQQYFCQNQTEQKYIKSPENYHQGENIKNKNKKNEFSKCHQDEQESSESSRSQESEEIIQKDKQLNQNKPNFQDIRNKNQLMQFSQKQSYCRAQQQNDNKQKCDKEQSVRMSKKINKQLFKILVHYYPDGELQISKIIQYLTTQSTSISQQSDQIYQSIQSLKQGGRNIIVYGQMSQKTTLIKKYLKYGKNQFVIQTEELQPKNVQIYYLEGLNNYFILKSKANKFLIETESIHAITPTQITQTLIYIHPLSKLQIQENFGQKLQTIFLLSCYKDHYKPAFEKDCWTCFSDLYQIYAECQGTYSLVSKIDTFLNILQKQFTISRLQRTKKKIDGKILLKQLITIMIQLFIYSLDTQNRKKMIVQSKKKKYFQLNELKGVNVEDLYNYTSINLETQKIEQLIKRQRFIFKNIFPIQREIAIVKKYFSLEKKYISCLLNLQQENDPDMAQIKQELSSTSPLKNFTYLFLTENHIINDTIHRFFKQQFTEDFKHFKKYIPNSKFIHKCIEDTPLNVDKRLSFKKTKTLIVIQDLHLAIKQEQTSIKIMLDHYAQFDKSKFYIFFMNKYIRNSDKDPVRNPKKYSFMPSLVFIVGEVNFQSIFKYQIKNGLHQNVVQRVKKLRSINGLLSNDIDYLKFVLNCQVKLPSQLYEKFFLASVILFSLTSSPEFQDFHAKYGTSQTQQKMSLTELRTPQNFLRKLQTTISSISNTLNVSYKYSSFVKRKSYMQLTESQIQKTIEKVINLFGKHCILQNSSNIINNKDRKKQQSTMEIKQLGKVNSTDKFSVQYLLKNHLRKYLHLSLSLEKIYIIEEEITVLPYLISEIHQNRLYTLSEEINFIEKFIQIVIKEMQTLKERDNSNQSFIILIKPPLALSQLFSQILNLIVKKTNFLDFCRQFQVFVNAQKQKAEFIYNQLDLYEEKIKLFYKTVFNQCKFIISIKECHKSLFSKIIEPEQKFIRQSSFKQQNRLASSKSKKRLSQRDSLINRQLFRSSQVFSFKKYQEYYNNDVSSVNKLGKDFWQQIVYLNLVMSVKEKLDLSKYLIKKYFKFFCEQSKENAQNVSEKQQQTIHMVEKKNLESSDLQRLALQFESFMTQILQTILEKYNLPIRSIDLMIKESIQLILDRKSKQRTCLDLKILKQEIEIPQNIITLRQTLQKATCILEKRIQSQTKIKDFLLYSINSDEGDKNSPQQLMKSMEQQSQTSNEMNLPRRKQKIQSFIRQNQKQIQSLKQQFYFSTIQEVQQIYIKTQLKTQRSQHFQESSKSSFYSVRSKVQSRNKSSEGKSVFFQELLSKLNSEDISKQFQKIFEQNFIVIEDKLLPNKFSLSLAQLFNEAKLKYHTKLQNTEKQQRNNIKRVSIDKNTLQVAISRSKSNSKLRSSQSSKGKTKNVQVLDEKNPSRLKLNENMRKSNHLNAVDIQTIKEEINYPQNSQLKMDFLSMNQSQFVSNYPSCTMVDLIYQRYIRFITKLYEKYQFKKHCQNDDSEKPKIAAFQNQMKNIQYFLSIDLLTIQKEQLRHLQQQTITMKKQLQMLTRYIQICQKFTKVNNKHSHIMSEEDQGSRQLISQQVKRNIYEMIFMNTLSNIKDNSQLNDRIKKILCIDNEHSLVSSIKKLSKNRINLTLSQQIQIKTLEQKSKFIISDPNREFNHLIKNVKAQIIFINKANLNEAKKLRFKLVFFVFYVESMQHYYQLKDLIDQVNRIIEQKATDSKSNNQKLVLLVSTKKILDQLNIEEEHYTTLNLQFTYMKFSQQINIKKQKLSRQETQNLFESYTNAYSKLFKLSKQIGKLSVDQKDEILACLQKAEQPVLNHFQTLTKQIESIYEEKNKRNFEEGKCTVIYQYLSKLIEEEIIPYRYVKRINQKLDWSKMEELISTYSKTRRKQAPARAVPTGFKQQIKEWLGKQLLALRSETFLDQFKECITVSNVIVLVYEILHQKIFRQIEMIAQSQKIDFSFFFEFPNLKKRNFLNDIDETGQVNFHQNSKQKQLNINILDKDLFKNSYTSFDNFERQTNKAFGRNSIVRKKKTDDSLENIDYSQKKRIYFVHEKEIYKVKEVIHICSIIWV